MENFNAQIDVREIEPTNRIGVIFTTFDNLKPGERMEITNDHDPNHLHQKLNVDREGQFDWKYLAEGPDIWRIQITKM
jgi:uncharacterized protein (DUF2249 family)